MFRIEVFLVLTLCSIVVGYHHGLPKRRYHTTTLHGVTIHKTRTWIFTAVISSSLAMKSYWTFDKCQFVLPDIFHEIQNRNMPIFLKNGSRYVLLYRRAVWKFRGHTLLLRFGTMRKCGDGLFFEVPSLASEALLKTLHPLLRNVLQTVCRKL
jgi:hypothetical protein